MQQPIKEQDEHVDGQHAEQLNRFFDFIASVVSNQKNNSPAAQSFATKTAGAGTKIPLWRYSMSNYKPNSFGREYAEYAILEHMRIAAHNIIRNKSVEAGRALLDAIDNVMLIWMRRGARLERGSSGSSEQTDE